MYYVCTMLPCFSSLLLWPSCLMLYFLCPSSPLWIKQMSKQAHMIVGLGINRIQTLLYPLQYNDLKDTKKNIRRRQTDLEENEELVLYRICTFSKRMWKLGINKIGKRIYVGCGMLHIHVAYILLHLLSAGQRSRYWASALLRNIACSNT